MPNINITVAEKIATNTTPGVVIVCGNSDYTVSFAFDAEWSAETNRVARFVYYKDGLSLYQDVAFTGNTVAVPTLYGVAYVLVGVYAGNLRTTTPAKVLCDRSILCGDPLEVLTPEAKAELQAQIDALREAQENGGGVLSQTLRTAIYNLLMDAVYQSTGHESDKAALAELLTGGDTGGDTGDDTGGDTGETVTVLFSSLEQTTGIMQTSGTATTTSSARHVQFPYVEGMVVSCYLNDSWLSNGFAPVVVSDNGVYTALNGDRVGGSGTVGQYVVSLTGYSENTIVYANFKSGASDEYCYYSYES